MCFEAFDIFDIYRIHSIYNIENIQHVPLTSSGIQWHPTEMNALAGRQER